MNENKLDKLKNFLSQDTVSELEGLSKEDLKTRIGTAEKAIHDAQEELEANEQFKELKASLSALSLGMRDVRKRQRGIVKLCCLLLAEKGSE